jgi:molecular chaperone GrpE
MAEKKPHDSDDSTGATPGTDATSGTGRDAQSPQPGMDGASEGAATSGKSVEDIIPGIGAAADAETRIAELEVERDELKDKLLRALAETENIRRRAERDRKDAETFGGTRLARDLLAVYDNLSRAMDAADETLKQNHGAFLEGVELTQRELLNAFEKHKIQLTEPQKGDKFDPNLHQAMFEAPVPGAQNGTVIEVMQPGFTIAGRLLRPALVGVARAAPEAAQEAPPQAEPKANGTDGA